jgi:zinc transport system permease protein
METSSLALSIVVAIAAGLVGCFAVMRKMTLASDAISHVALPGIGIAMALHVHPVLGGVAMLFLGALLIWAIETRTGMSTETIIGVVFSAALAVGSLLTSGEDLIDALLGGVGALTGWEVALGGAGAAAVIALLLSHRSRLVVALVSPDIARTVGIDVRRLDLVFLLGFALTVALGLRYLGVLLMGSLIIIPAATAKQLARNLGGMFSIAVASAVFSVVAGTFAAARLHYATGPVVITFAATLFFLSLLRPRNS